MIQSQLIVSGIRNVMSHDCPSGYNKWAWREDKIALNPCNVQRKVQSNLMPELWHMSRDKLKFKNSFLLALAFGFQETDSWQICVNWCRLEQFISSMHCLLGLFVNPVINIQSLNHYNSVAFRRTFRCFDCLLATNRTIEIMCRRAI